MKTRRLETNKAMLSFIYLWSKDNLFSTRMKGGEKSVGDKVLSERSEYMLNKFKESN